MNILLENDHFLVRNQHYLLAIMIIGIIALLVFAIITYWKSSKLTKSLLVNKFKVLDMNEKNTQDNAPLYTIIVSNNSMNAIALASIGFEHDGDFFNYRNECKAQIEGKNKDLIVLPRSSLKLRLYKVQLESAVFATSRRKKLGAIRVYIVGLGGESYKVKTKVIGKKMKESYKEYYAYHETEVIAKFLSACNHKISNNVKLKFFEKLRFKHLSKRYSGLQIPEYVSPIDEYNNAPNETPYESTVAMPYAIKDCEIVEEAVATESVNPPKEVAKAPTENAEEPDKDQLSFLNNEEEND